MSRLSERLQKAQEKRFYPCIACDYTHMCETCDFKRYLDLEEQGRLIVLPCKFGEDAWFVCKHLIYGEVGDAAEVKWFVDKRQFNFANYVSHQRMAYATKEEAEAKLAELKGDTNEL